MQHDLVDEFRILVYPVVLGSGKRLFRDGLIALTTLLRGHGHAVWSVCMGVADGALRRRMSPDTIGSIHL